MSILRRLLSIRHPLDDEPVDDSFDYEPSDLEKVEADLYDPSDDVGDKEQT